ncbi:hypothetical protein BD410DRAFT_681434, partial [Rickenella mellea]
QQQVTLPYFVPRNSRGSLPVHSLIRNGGSRYQIQIKHIQGNILKFRDDLAHSLFRPHSGEAARLKTEVQASRSRILLSGGRWKTQVVDWLKQNGF